MSGQSQRWQSTRLNPPTFLLEHVKLPARDPPLSIITLGVSAQLSDHMSYDRDVELELQSRMSCL
jgi:hypothetical protein